MYPKLKGKEAVALLLALALGCLAVVAGRLLARAGAKEEPPADEIAFQLTPTQPSPLPTANAKRLADDEPRQRPRRLPPPPPSDSVIDRGQPMDAFRQPAVEASMQPALTQRVPPNRAPAENSLNKEDLLELRQQLEAMIAAQLAGVRQTQVAPVAAEVEPEELEDVKELDDSVVGDALEIREQPPELQLLTATQRQRGLEAIAKVESRVQELVEAGVDAGRRGAAYTARDKMLDALRLLAQAADAATHCRNRTTRLTDGLRALEESADFAMDSDALNTALAPERIVARHRSHLVGSGEARAMTRLALQQRYLEHAQQSLSAAARGSRAGSQALLGLAKFYLTRASEEGLKRQGPRAVALCQSALEIDPLNHAAANELGALLAQYGRLEDAKQMLLRSLRTQPSMAAWHNLATVHQRVGETGLADAARREARSMETSMTAGAPRLGFVDPRTFAATHPGPAGASPLSPRQVSPQTEIPAQPKTASIHRWTR